MAHDSVENGLVSPLRELPSCRTRGADDRLVLILRLWQPRLLRTLVQESEEGVSADQDAW